MADSDGGYRNSSKLSVRAAFNGRHGTRSWFGWVAENTPMDPGARVLDIGCGPAWFWARTIGDRPPLSLTLADRSEGMVAEARARMAPLARVHTVVADAMALPFPDASFDTVLAMHMMYHVPDPRRALAEFRRVLAPGGRLYVTTVGDDDLAPVNQLSRTVFGSAGADMITARFGSTVAARLMAEAFGEVGHQRLSDTYRLTDPEEIAAMLGSFPPASEAGEDGIRALTEAAAAAIAASGGVMEAERLNHLYSVRL